MQAVQEGLLNSCVSSFNPIAPSESLGWVVRKPKDNDGCTCCSYLIAQPPDYCSLHSVRQISSSKLK